AGGSAPTPRAGLPLCVAAAGVVRAVAPGRRWSRGDHPAASVGGWHVGRDARPGDVPGAVGGAGAATAGQSTHVSRCAGRAGGVASRRRAAGRASGRHLRRRTAGSAKTSRSNRKAVVVVGT